MIRSSPCFKMTSAVWGLIIPNMRCLCLKRNVFTYYWWVKWYIHRQSTSESAFAPFHYRCKKACLLQLLCVDWLCILCGLCHIASFYFDWIHSGIFCTQNTVASNRCDFDMYNICLIKRMKRFCIWLSCTPVTPLQGLRPYITASHRRWDSLLKLNILHKCWCCSCCSAWTEPKVIKHGWAGTFSCGSENPNWMWVPLCGLFIFHFVVACEHLSCWIKLKRGEGQHADKAPDMSPHLGL